MADDSGFECRRCEWMKGNYKKENGCHGEVERVVVKAGPIELHRCPRAILRDGLELRYELDEIFGSYEYRTTRDYTRTPAALIAAWNEISLCKSLVMRSAQEKRKEEIETARKAQEARSQPQWPLLPR